MYRAAVPPPCPPPARTAVAVPENAPILTSLPPEFVRVNIVTLSSRRCELAKAVTVLKPGVPLLGRRRKNPPSVEPTLTAAGLPLIAQLPSAVMVLPAVKMLRFSVVPSASDAP